LTANFPKPSKWEEGGILFTYLLIEIAGKNNETVEIQRKLVSNKGTIFVKIANN